MSHTFETEPHREDLYQSFTLCCFFGRIMLDCFMPPHQQRVLFFLCKMWKRFQGFQPLLMMERVKTWKKITIRHIYPFQENQTVKTFDFVTGNDRIYGKCGLNLQPLSQKQHHWRDNYRSIWQRSHLVIVPRNLNHCVFDV